MVVSRIAPSRSSGQGSKNYGFDYGLAVPDDQLCRFLYHAVACACWGTDFWIKLGAGQPQQRNDYKQRPEAMESVGISGCVGPVCLKLPLDCADVMISFKVCVAA